MAGHSFAHWPAAIKQWSKQVPFSLPALLSQLLVQVALDELQMPVHELEPSLWPIATEGIVSVTSAKPSQNVRIMTVSSWDARVPAVP